MKDKRTTIQELKGRVSRFVKKRDWEKYHTPKNLSMSIAIEAAELMENFQWDNLEDSLKLLNNPKKRKKIEEELADIAIYVIDFCNLHGIDLSAIVKKKLNRNSKKYPVRLSRGKAYKYNELGGKRR